MKKNLPTFSGSYLHVTLFLFLAIIGQLFFNPSAQAQIYRPEGLNMPGAWNGWTNPPTNNLALASSTQVAGGRIAIDTVGTQRWHTSFSVAATGGDLVGGSYEWLFTSGASSNYFNNKWSGVTVAMNTLQNYTYQGAANNSVTLVNNKWYTINWEDLGYMSSRAIFMETSAQPVNITTISVPVSVAVNTAASIAITISQAKSAEEIIYVRYTTDAWATSTAVAAAMTGTSGTALIPGQAAGTTVAYYAFSSTVAALTENFDLNTINKLNNAGLNYSYTVAAPPPAITWANLQYPASGAIETGQAFDVFGQALIPGVTGQTTAAPGLQAWVGYSITNTNPNTWTNWVVGTYNAASGNNDEFKADLGTVITAQGTYYYATRFQLNADAYVYGGYNGGFWDGTVNISGTLTVTDPVVAPDFDWANLQFPDSGSIEPSQDYLVFAQAFRSGITGQPTAAPGIQSWIGYSTDNTNPATWTNWVPAAYTGPSGNNDEFSSNLGTQLSALGTYYYASRFQLNTGDYFYGGYSVTGGGFWDGTTNISGVVEVEMPGPGIDWANLQYPSSDTIVAVSDFTVYAQAYIEGVTGQPTAAPGLQGWIGYSTTNTDPATWTNWLPADYNMASGNNDEFKANIGTQFTGAGVWFYASRFQLNSGEYVYGGYSATGGGFWDGSDNKSGELTVELPVISFPVLFTIIDGTLKNKNIKLKGEMTNWTPVSMDSTNNTWTLTLNLAPGTYEWGAIEDDGSASGIWLITGPNLVVTVDASGIVTGTVTYTTLITGIAETASGIKVYPNPTSDVLFLDMPQDADIRLINMNGKVLLQQKFASGHVRIDMSGYNAGIYHLEIINGKDMLSKTVIRK
jgi:hypothetical protein